MVRIMRSVRIELPEGGHDLRVATRRSPSSPVVWPQEGGHWVDIMMGEGTRIVYGLLIPDGNGESTRIWKKEIVMQHGQMYLDGELVSPFTGTRDCLGVLVKPSWFTRRER